MLLPNTPPAMVLRLLMRNNDLLLLNLVTDLGRQSVASAG
jgi:hypothetical protein